MGWEGGRQRDEARRQQGKEAAAAAAVSAPTAALGLRCRLPAASRAPLDLASLESLCRLRARARVCALGHTGALYTAERAPEVPSRYPKLTSTPTFRPPPAAACTRAPLWTTPAAGWYCTLFVS